MKELEKSETVKQVVSFVKAHNMEPVDCTEQFKQQKQQTMHA